MAGVSQHGLNNPWTIESNVHMIIVTGLCVGGWAGWIFFRDRGRGAGYEGRITQTPSIVNLVLDGHWKIIKLNAWLFDFNTECAWKTMNQGLIIGGLNRNSEFKNKLFNIFRRKEGLDIETWSIDKVLSYKGNFHWNICRKCTEEISTRPLLNFNE